MLSYFSKRPEDLLVINYIQDPSASTKVANFLGFDGIQQKPKENTNPKKNIPEKYKKMLLKCTVELNIPENELAYDIYCPSLVDRDSYKAFPPDSSMLKQV